MEKTENWAFPNLWGNFGGYNKFNISIFTDTVHVVHYYFYLKSINCTVRQTESTKMSKSWAGPLSHIKASEIDRHSARTKAVRDCTVLAYRYSQCQLTVVSLGRMKSKFDTVIDTGSMMAMMAI